MWWNTIRTLRRQLAEAREHSKDQHAFFTKNSTADREKIGELAAQVQELHRQNAELASRVAKERSDAAYARKIAEDLRTEVKELGRSREVKLYLERLRKMELSTDEVKFAMGQIDANDPGFMAIVTTLQEQISAESETALKPGLSDADRQYGAGRMAAVTDLAHALVEMRIEGERLRQEMENGKAA
jgi:outer membrane murein-binding lipoprotein Lpp